ncbi:MAG TPA: nickel pincer cofactor biosynthesis protein LarC [Nitrospirota bacterium]
MKTAYFDCFSGISGDMFIGALIDAGLDFKKWKAEIDKLGLTEVAVSRKKAVRSGLAGSKLVVKDDGKQPFRNLEAIEKLVNKSKVSASAKRRGLEILRRIAEAEAEAHGVPVEQVHFHEIGAADTVVDVMGAVIAVELMGIGQVLSSPINLGSGTIKFSHGIFPVPAPATAALMKGFPSYTSEIKGELTTPTGAAVITTLAEPAVTMPVMLTDKIGYGAGDKEFPGSPNMLRVFVGEVADGHEADTAVLIETNIDDMDPRLYELAMDRLFAAGALDVWLTPIIMKKSRPAAMLSVLAAPDLTSRLADIILRETTTFGIRITQVGRRKLEREFVLCETGHGKVSVKVGRLGGKVIKAVPEYEDIKAVSKASGKPSAEIIRAAEAAALKPSGRRKA